MREVSICGKGDKAKLTACGVNDEGSALAVRTGELGQNERGGREGVRLLKSEPFTTLLVFSDQMMHSPAIGNEDRPRLVRTQCSQILRLRNLKLLDYLSIAPNPKVAARPSLSHFGEPHVA